MTNRFITKCGYAGLEQGVQYHRVRLGEDAKRVHLVAFAEAAQCRAMDRSYVFNLDRFAFEEALLSGAIEPAPTGHTLPAWLKAVEGIDPPGLDHRRPYVTRLHMDLIDSRYAAIEPLLNDIETLSSFEDISAELNKRIRSRCVGHNLTRVRFWLMLYLSYGKEKAALLPNYFGRAIRKRITNIETGQTGAVPRKIGRPRLDNKPICPCTDEFIEKIQRGYDRRMAKGRSWAEVYADVLVDEFGCLAAGPNDGFQIYHPSGLPFPSLAQFKYYVRKKYWLSEIYDNRLGPQRTRNREQISKGHYSEAYADLMQHCQIDAHYVKERPVSLLYEKMPGSPLLIVTVIDLASGLIVGVGFGVGSESASAYRQALACAAMDKREFMSHFGISIAKEDWPSKGLPQAIKLDNGPGSSELVRGSIREFVAQFGTTPAYTPQSNAVVESSHPRNVKTQGAPEYTQSNLNVVQMMRRHLKQVIVQNASSDASKRLTPEMVAAGVQGTPLAIWNYLHRRGRINAQEVSEREIIEKCLKPLSLSVEKGVLYLNKTEYRTSDPELKRILQLHRTHRKINGVEGYGFELNLRTIWVKLGGALYILQVVNRLPVTKDQEHLSFQDIQEIGKGIAREESKSQERKAGGAVWLRLQQESQIKKNVRSVVRKGRAPTRTPEQRLELKLAKQQGVARRPKP